MAEKKLQVNLISKPENILKLFIQPAEPVTVQNSRIEVYDEAPDNEKMLNPY